LLFLLLLCLLFVYRFKTEDDRLDGYQYKIGICTSGLIEGDLKTAGAVQVKKESPTTADDKAHMPHNIGSFEQAEVMGGSE